jgi:N,N'-diacetyllegionaminate synthase
MTKETFIIAEVGVNHNGFVSFAKKLIDVAAEAGVDAVKFQTFKADKLVSRTAQKAEYQKQTTASEESHYEMIKKLELDENAHRELIGYCERKKVIFLSTPFDLDSIDMLKNFGIPIFKIPSGEITNLPYLRHIGSIGRKVILSTGMADLGEIEGALNILTKEGLPRDKITILHATTEYPCPMEEVNLQAMQTIRDTFGYDVGYSDHTRGIEVAIAAVAMGASVIEKHFTLDRNLPGPDHKASLEPYELKSMVNSIRNIDKAIGDGIKRPSKSEVKNIPIARKSLVATCVIIKGEVFSQANLTAKRPGTGVSPMRWDEVLGRKAPRRFETDELIEL